MFRLFFLLLAVGLFGIAAEQREMDVTGRMGLQVGQQRRQVRSCLVERFVQTGIADELPDSPLPGIDTGQDRIEVHQSRIERPGQILTLYLVGKIA